MIFHARRKTGYAWVCRSRDALYAFLATTFRE